jgi:hypothetical protein
MQSKLRNFIIIICCVNLSLFIYATFHVYPSKLKKFIYTIFFMSIYCDKFKNTYAVI